MGENKQRHLIDATHPLPCHLYFLFQHLDLRQFLGQMILDYFFGTLTRVYQVMMHCDFLSTVRSVRRVGVCGIVVVGIPHVDLKP